MPNISAPNLASDDSVSAKLPAFEANPLDIQDLLNHINFDYKNGQIWFGEQRMLLNHANALSRMREDLATVCGVDATQGVFFRYGYYAGLNDAEIAKKIRPNATWHEVYLAGPQLHTLRGMVKVVPYKVEDDFENQHFFASFDWYNSFEVDYYLKHHGLAEQPICMTLLGYASGYTSYFLGKQVAFKEVQCAAMGHEHCRIEGRILEDWQEETPSIRYLETERLNTQIFEQRSEFDELKRQHPSKSIDTPEFFKAIGHSPAFKKAITMLSKVARSKATVLLQGETGVGKEVFAQGLHQLSDRKHAEFIAINCASIPPDLIESELFGVEKGAFTGATHTRKGKFELANGGTLFLDEIIELSPRAQASLLRVLQESELGHVGSNNTIKIDVRVVVATNESLEQAVATGKFRRDLYYRINTFPIIIPPLRERKEDILPLADFFLKKFRAMYDKPIKGFTDQAKNQMLIYPWHGNVRELQSAVERGVILTNADNYVAENYIDSTSLFPEQAFNQPAVQSSILQIEPKNGRLKLGDNAENTSLPSNSLPHSDADSQTQGLMDNILIEGFDLEAFNQQLIERALQKCQGNISETARLLNMSRAKLDYRIKLKNSPSP